MTALFISYRRKDSSASAGRLYDRLAPVFDQVFKDVDNISPGEDYRVKLNDAIILADVVLVIIGPDWLTITGADGGRRLDHPEDFVRYEIEQALTGEQLVIPVLVNGASMPDDDALPPSIRQLSYLHAAVVGQDPNFHRDVDRLITVINEGVGRNSVKQVRDKPRRRGPLLWIGILAAAMLVLLALIMVVGALQEPPVITPSATLTTQADDGTATNTPEPTPIICEGFVASRLVIGEQGQVTPGEPNNLRAEPSTDAERLDRMTAGDVFLVLEGPVCAESLAWWRVEYGDLTGWTAEGEGSDYWLEPVE